MIQVFCFSLSRRSPDYSVPTGKGMAPLIAAGLGVLAMPSRFMRTSCRYGPETHSRHTSIHIEDFTLAC